MRDDDDKFGPDDFPEWIEEQERTEAHARLKGHKILPTSSIAWLAYEDKGAFTLAAFRCFSTSLGGALLFEDGGELVLIADILRGVTELGKTVIVCEGDEEIVPTRRMVQNAMKKFNHSDEQILLGA